MSNVKLVGVGPGHPGLATVLAIEAIKDADVIRHSDGCGVGLLHLAAAAADVGPLQSVDEVVRLARTGKTITVLFPGNPYAFSNGSEVAEKLERAGVDFEAVPGLIVELAAPVMSGIPLTIEGQSASMGFGLVKGAETVVLRLASGWWESGISALLADGRAADTPAALILNPGQSGQHRVSAPLGELARKAATYGLRGAALQVAVLEKSRYAAVIRSMSAATVMTNQDHRIAAVNPMAEALLQQSQADLIGRPWNQIFTVGDKGLSTPQFWHLSPTSGERGLRIRGRLPLRTHPEVVLDVLSTEYQSEGRPEGYVHVLQDVSAQEEYTRTKDDFLLNVAHELQGPLASWRISLDSLMEDYTSIGTRDMGVMLRTLQRTALKLQTLVETLVDIGRMQAGRFLVRPVRTRFNQLVLDSLSQIEPLLKTRGQTVDLQMECGTSCTVLADRQRVIQVVVNLLKNASKYGPEDQPIGLSAYRSGGYVFVEVADRGPGIPPEEQAHLFTRFYRIKLVEEEGAGIGIGLALVKGIIESHGGQVGVRSRPGEGATFWFNLPEVTQSEA